MSWCGSFLTLLVTASAIGVGSAQAQKYCINIASEHDDKVSRLVFYHRECNNGRCNDWVLVDSSPITDFRHTTLCHSSNVTYEIRFDEWTTEGMQETTYSIDETEWWPHSWQPNGCDLSYAHYHFRFEGRHIVLYRGRHPNASYDSCH